MSISSTRDVEDYLRKNKNLFYNKFGVIRIGLFGSFVLGQQTRSSDIDIIVEFEKHRKNIHNFLGLKRFLEQELGRKVDLGVVGSLKPPVKEKVERQILYV